jgi:hypothetical protein
MYTEEDLRATLSALESEAPGAAGVLAALARARRRQTVRRRVVRVVAAAVVAGVVAGGSVLVADLAGPDRGPAAADPHFERLRFPFAVDESSGFRAAYGAVRFDEPATAWVGAVVVNSDVLYSYELDVYAAGRYDPSNDTAGEPVQVNGRTGFYRGDVDCRCDTNIRVPGVAWEYAPDSWAVVRYQPAAMPGSVPPSDVRETLLRVAEAVRFDRTTPVRLPFKVGYLPAGLQPDEFAPAEMNTVVIGHASVALAGDAGRLDIWIAESFDGSGAHGEPVVRVEEGDVKLVTVNLGEIFVQLTGKGFSVDELKKIARSITPAAGLRDVGTWFDATQALPLH